MKNQLFALVGLGLLLAAASAYAQTGVGESERSFRLRRGQSRASRRGNTVIQSLGMTGALMTIQSSDDQILKAVIAERLSIG